MYERRTMAAPETICHHAVRSASVGDMRAARDRWIEPGNHPDRDRGEDAPHNRHRGN